MSNTVVVGLEGLGGGQTDIPRIIDVTDIEALLVRKDGDGGDVFTIDTNALRAIIGGTLISGPGTKHDGFIKRPAAEVQTTDDTQTTLDSITLEDENTYHVEAYIINVKSDGTERASYHFAATVYRTGAGSATIQNSVTLIHEAESDTSPEATFTVNGNDLRVSVTGIAAETWEWGCILQYSNLSN